MSITHRVRRTLGVAMAGAMVLSLLPAGAAFASNHEDICDDAPAESLPSYDDQDSISGTFEEYVECMGAYGIARGFTDGTFGPGQNVTRQQMASFVARFISQAEDGDVDIPTSTPAAYTDRATISDQHIAAVDWLSERGVVEGFPDGSYRPGVNVSRQQMASFIARAIEEVGGDLPEGDDDTFEDVEADSVHADNINALAAAGIVQGFGDGSYRPGNAVTRQQMSQFVILGAAELDDQGLWDGEFIVDEDPSAAVNVTPTASATQAPGTARQYTATLTNDDGTPYTGAVHIRLRDANAEGGLASPGEAATGVQLENVEGVTPPPGTTEYTVPFAGIDGEVTFLVRHTTPNTAADAIPQVFRGNSAATTNAVALGGAVFFTAQPVQEASAQETGAVVVTSTNKAANEFVGTIGGNTRRYVWDNDDIFLPAGQADFVARLSVGDTVTVGPYAPTSAPGQSTFNLTNDVVTPVGVSTPAGPVNVDADTYTITGTANPGWQVVAYRNLDDPAYQPAVDPAVSTAVTVSGDGAYSVTVPLSQGTASSPAANDFILVQRPAGSSTTAPPADANRDTQVVPTITESPTAAFSLNSVVADGDGGVIDGTLDAGDTLTLTFSHNVTMAANASITLRDVDGTVLTLTRGSTMTCTPTTGDTTAVTCEVQGVPLPSTVGGTPGIQLPAQVDAISGFTATSGGQAAAVGTIVVTGDL